MLGEVHHLVDAARHDDAAARQDHRELAPRREARWPPSRLLGPPGPRSTRIGVGIIDVGLAVEQVARDVELGRAALEHAHSRSSATAARQCGAWRAVDLVFGDLLEEGQLLGFLEAAEALRVRAGLGRDHHHRAVRPIGGGDGGDEIGDARPVLGDADAMRGRWRGQKPSAMWPAPCSWATEMKRMPAGSNRSSASI